MNASLIVAFIILASSITYGNTLQNGFVYDDTSVLVNNPWIKDTRYIVDILTRDVWGFTGEALPSHHYRPLFHLINMLEYRLFGLNSTSFHAVNIILHACMSVMVFVIIKTLMGRSASVKTGVTVPALMAGILFAVHPVHSEAVAWISARTELSFSFFILLSFWLYIRSYEKTWNAGYLLSLPVFALALLSKESAIILPVILLVHDIIFHGDKGWYRETAKRLLPFFGLIGIYLAFRVLVLGGFAPRNVHADLAGYQYVINIFPLFCWYLLKLPFPINLNVFHDLHPLSSLLNLHGILSVAVTAGFVSCIGILRKNRLAVLGALIMAISLMPALYIPALGEAFVAERYLYLPSFGFVMMIASGIERTYAFPAQFRRATIAMILIISGIYAAATIERNTVWQDNFTLFSDAVNKSPDAALPRTNLGNAYIEREYVDEAIRQYEIAVRLKPSAVEPHANLGFAYMAQGRIDEALREYDAVLWLNPEYPMARQYYAYLMNKMHSVETGRKNSGKRSP